MTQSPASLGGRIRDLADATPRTVALRYFPRDGDRQDLTYGDLDRRSDQVAALLRHHDVRAGQRVAIGLRNSPEAIVAALGAWKVGAGIVTMRWDVPDWERDRLLSVTSPAVVLADRDERTADGFDVIDVAHADSVAAERVCIVSPAQPMAIPTGGSTGASKAVVLPVPGELVPGSTYGAYSETFGVPAITRQLVMGPLYHGSPLMMTHLGLFDGQQILLMEKFDGARALQIVSEYRPDYMLLVPTMMRRLLDVPGIDEMSWDGFSLILHGTAPCPAWLKRRWIALVGDKLLWEIFASSELVGSLIVRGDEWLAHPSTVGRPAGGTELRILDDDLNEVPTGEVGEMYMRQTAHDGPMFDYLGVDRPKIVDGGFVSVGDLGRVDADGYVYSADRKGDLIITGGANVVPAEVEAALGEHPDVVDVVVIGVADDDWGQRVHAVVQTHADAQPPTEDALRAFAKARLVSYKVPKTIEFVERIPRSEMFKVRRSALAAERPRGSDRCH